MANLIFGPDLDADSLSPSEVASLQCSPFSSQGIILFACFFDSLEEIKALGSVFLNEPLQAKDSDPVS